MDSPFIYNNIVSGPDFIARTSELDLISKLIKEHKCAVIYEPAKNGKQSFIQQAFQKIRYESYKYKVCNINLFNVRTEELLYHKLEKALLETFNSNKPFVGTFGSPSELLELGEKLAEENGFDLVIYIEEFQNILHFSNSYDVLKKFEQACLHLIGKDKGSEGKDSGGKDNEQVPGNQTRRVSMIFSGSFVNAMKEIFEKKKFFYNMAQRVKLSKIDERSFIEHIVKSFLKAGRVVPKELAQHIYTLTDGQPWYTQQLADIGFGLTRGYLTEGIINQAFKLLMEMHSYRFKILTSRLSIFQINILRAILDGAEKLSAADTMDKYQLQSSANVNRLKEALEKKEIIEFTKYGPVFLDPLFKTWMQEIYFGITTQND